MADIVVIPDIVERLRSKLISSSSGYLVPDLMAAEAANEIERLQTALRYHVNELQEARRQAIRDAAEIERLQAALPAAPKQPGAT